MARRKVAAQTAKPRIVEFVDKEPSAFATMLGGLIEANVMGRPEKTDDFASLAARVGIWVTEIDEGVTLDFRGGKLSVYNGLKPNRAITIRTDAATVMALSNLRIGVFGLPVYYDDLGRSVVLKLVQGGLKIDGLFGNLATLNTVTRLFSVR
jgi:hypothetical protein